MEPLIETVSMCEVRSSRHSSLDSVCSKFQTLYIYNVLTPNVYLRLSPDRTNRYIVYSVILELMSLRMNITTHKTDRESLLV